MFLSSRQNYRLKQFKGLLWVVDSSSLQIFTNCLSARSCLTARIFTAIIAIYIVLFLLVLSLLYWCFIKVFCYKSCVVIYASDTAPWTQHFGGSSGIIKRSGNVHGSLATQNTESDCDCGNGASACYSRGGDVALQTVIAAIEPAPVTAEAKMLRSILQELGQLREEQRIERERNLNCNVWNRTLSS